MNMMQMRTNLPKLSLMKLALYISEWLLLLEDSEAWLAEPRVLFAWHLVFFSSLVVILLPNVVFFLFESALTTSMIASLILRWGMVVGVATIISMYATLAALFYKHLLLTGRDLRFRSVATFWVGWVILFGQLYMQIYFVSPTSVTFQHPFFVPTPTVAHISPLLTYKLKAYFYTYSSCLATAINFPNIASNSLLISIINVVEGIGSLLFIALMVATFVGKELSRKHK